MCLIAEKKSAVRHRRCLKHVIHVNGTRGKSAVTRLIAAGLTAGGYKTFCKTTGTLPMTIDPDGNEAQIIRRGCANISEQVGVLKKAAESGADVLVVECMAVDPELQYVAEHRILNSDIGVITNVRIDHVAEMGSEIPEVCRALSNTIPENGRLFTADSACFDILAGKAKLLHTEAYLAQTDKEPAEDEPFPENIALALAVCESLGVEKSVALAGMKKTIKDPYTSSMHHLSGGAVFIDGMSANDPVSTREVFERYTGGINIRKKIFVLNTRADRGYRTELMIKLIREEKPDEVWILGGGKKAAERKLKNSGLITITFKNAGELPLNIQSKGTVIYAIGNIANEGFRLIDRVRREEADVR